MNCPEEGECIDDSSVEVISLDSAVEFSSEKIESTNDEDDDIQEVPQKLNESSCAHHNLDLLEKTLPPGVAPDGFILLDESIAIAEDEDKKIENPEEDKKSENPEDEPVPTFQVIFKNEAIAHKYRKKVREFLKKLLGPQATSKRDETKSSDCVLNIWGKNDLKHGSGSKKGAVNGSEEEILFTIDTKPEKEKFESHIPVYGKKKFDKVLIKEGVVQNEEEKDTTINANPKLTCFNCMGNHTIRECTEPKNPWEINKNRKEFTSNKSISKNVRYHLDEEQKFGHLQPGKLSFKLRNALGLDDDQLPNHIFRMRILGYPPGWLEEARLEHSGMILYNSNDSKESDPDDELGEISDPESKVKYDIKKLHDFPGFNVPLPAGVQDNFWHPENQAMHSKERMLATLIGSKKAEDGYKRKKMKLTASTVENSDNSCVELVEMDVEMNEEDTTTNDLDELPENGSTSGSKSPETRQATPPPPGVESSDTSIVEHNDVSSTPVIKTKALLDVSGLEGSPSLVDLENKKKLLLEELDDSSSQSNPATPVRGNCKTDNSTPTGKFGSVKSSEYGTPLIQSTSPYSRLPSSDKFSKDICDVIHFENLPDSTGKYEKMAGLIQKVRVTLADCENKNEN